MKHIDWGLIDYKLAWEQQEAIFAEAVGRKLNRQTAENLLILCEHPHVYTLGKSGKEQNLLLDQPRLREKNAAFVQTNRGGDITYHGPGQIVGYPIFDLESFGIGLKQYIFNLEESIINFLGTYNIESARLNGAAGVWLDAETKNARKICAIGVRSSHFVTMHGFALNVNTQLDYFNYINPCGFTDKGVTSMEKELGQKTDMENAKKRLRKEMEKVFEN